jgi:flagellar hook-associated protein 2
MAGVSFSGLSSGLDTQSIIAQLMKLERVPVQRIETRKSQFAQQRSIFGDVVAKMKTLQEKARALDTVGEAQTFSAKSDDDTVFEASASGDADAGNYDIQVKRLATNERTWSTGFASKTDKGLVGTGDLKITVGSDNPVTVSIDQAKDSLEDVAARINASGARVQASIVYDGTNYSLVVAGQSSGAANAIAFDDPTNLDLDVAENEKQAAQDSEIVMDEKTIHRSTNILTDVIKGVTIRLKKVSASTVGLSVDVDPAGMRAKVQAFVDAYNEVARVISSQFAWTGEAKGQGSLAGDSTLRDQLSRLQRIVTTEVAGLTGRYTALSKVGVSTHRDGTLALDADAFDKAVRDDHRGVALLFTREDASTGVAAQIDDAVASATDFDHGPLTLRSKGLDGRIAAADTEIARLEAQLARTEERLRAQFSALEQLMSALQAQGNALSGLAK